MVLKKLKPGMTVWMVKPATGLSIFNGRWETWSINIIEIDVINEKVFASWNGNKPEWYYKHSWSKWRLKRPED